MDFRIISIGTLSRHPLWPNDPGGRTPHATTTLIRSDSKLILVDPALPAQILEARLSERAGLRFANITDVFLTNFRPAHRRALTALDHANWWISEAEREIIGVNLIAQLEKIPAEDPQAEQLIQQDIELLQRCKPAPDRLAPQVDLFPLPGFTPGTCGLLLAEATMTTLIASDAVPTAEHLHRGQVLQTSYDIQQALESFTEAIEIADAIIPGHDNLLPNPTRRPF